MSHLEQAARAAQENQQTQQQNIVAYVQACAPELQRALPRGMSSDRIARIALTAVRNSPALAACTRDSFAGALLTASALGLEPNTPAGEAYLVPYKNECRLIIGYQGLIKLYHQHPLAHTLDAQPVYESDEFDYRLGTDPYLSHKPRLHARPATAQPVAYYALAQLANGATLFEVLSATDVDAVRQAQRGRTSDTNRPPDPQHWMERKTVLRQLFKRLPKSVEATWASIADEEKGSRLYQIVPEIQASLEAGPGRELPAPEGDPSK